MDYVNKSFGSKTECLAYLKEIFDQVQKGNLVIEENNIVIPDDQELKYKVKYVEDPGETKLTIKVKWPNDIPVPDVPEEEI